MPPKKAPPVVMFSTEQFEELVARITSSARPHDESSSTGTPVNYYQSSGSFAKCTSRFDGGKSADVEAFLDAILIYKDCTNITDVNAYKGLPMLLEGQAATWWKGVKQTVTDWDNAVQCLRDVYSKKLPAHLVYREIFAREQRESEQTELFICHIRALIAQLPYELTEQIQLDMVYGLLRRDIRSRITRTDFDSFQILVNRVRDIETSLEEITPNSDESKPPDKKSTRIRCSYCKLYGHLISDCRNKSRADSKKPIQGDPSPTDQGKEKTRPAIYCYGCKAPGVIRSECSTCSPKTKALVNVGSVDFCEATVIPEQNNYSRPTLPIKINDLRGSALADTGASRSIASKSLYEKLKNSHTFGSEQLKITLADGTTTSRTVKVVNVDIEIAFKKIPIPMLVLSTQQDNRTLLGMDFLNKAGIVIDTANNQWSFEDNNNIKYPYAEQILTPIATVSLAKMNEDSAKLREDEGIQLTTEERVRLDNLLEINMEIFRRGGDPTPYAEHRIQLKPDQVPIAVPPFRMAKVKKDQLRKELDALLAEDIIEECESPWAAPVVLVPKKEGTVRLCVDYRRLNEVTIGDSYPMPRIDDLLHSTKRTKYMSTIDLRSGYHQINVREEDRDITTFTTPFGTFRYKRMPFGLKNAPATFQRMMDRFRTGLNITVLAYLDDVIVMSETFDEHLEDLQKTFSRLKQFGLRANRGKCVFVRPKIEYLGHVLTTDGLQVNWKKVEAIRSMPIPTNLKHLKCFLQTCSWYRKFIEGFSGIAKPLTELTKKNSPWKWEKPQNEAFEKLKDALTTAPVLVQANEANPFILRTDASSYALGAVLLQKESNEERPVEYASRLLTEAERNYNTTEREALAVVWALNKFRGYLECSEVVVLTDHQPLRWLMTLKSPTGRLARWALQIQAFNLKIQYTPGKANVVADTLSRPVCEKTTQKYCGICTVSIDLPRREATDIRANQFLDPDVAKIIQDFESTTHSENASRWTQRGYLMTGGILYRYDMDSDSEDAQRVIPKHERTEILKEYHDSPTACHDGADRTLSRIKNKYYWTGMRKNVNEYVKSCLSCQRFKPSNWKPAGLLQTPPNSQRFEVVAIDFFGPLPDTKNGNRWILIIEDVASKWIELFAMPQATAVNTAKILVEEICLRYGTPRKIISDNGVQFVSEVVQQVCHCMNIHQSLIPLYHAEANPVERKNRDLKPRLAILVGKEHRIWDEKIAAIRFALNTAVCQSTGFTPAYLTFGRELRTGYEVQNDMRSIVDHDNFVPEITPYLRNLAKHLSEAKEKNEIEQDRQKMYADQHRQPAPAYEEGDQVLVKTHLLSQAAQGITAKFLPKRDGPYVVKRRVAPTTFEVAELAHPDVTIGKYHTSELTPYIAGEDETPGPVYLKRKRGRPRKPTPDSSARPPPRNQRGRV